MERISPALVRQVRKGDPQAFTQLILQHEQILSRVSLSILKDPDDAADAVQDAILAAWQEMGKLREANYFTTWLVRILINKCYQISAVRNKYTHSQLEEALCREEPPDWDSSLDIRATLERLKPEDKLLLGLYYYDGLSVKEIAKALDLREDCIKQRLHRGRKRFQAAYVKKEVLSHDK